MNTFAHTSFAVIGTTIASIATYNLIGEGYNPATLTDAPPVVYSVMIATAAFGAILPDIDNPDRFMGSKSKIIGPLISKRRGVTHSIGHFLIVSAILAAVMYFVSMPLVAKFAIFGVLYGYLTHLILDLFSTDGIPVFWLKKNYREHDLSLMGVTPGLMMDKNKYIKLPPKKNAFLKLIVWGVLLYGSINFLYILAKIFLPLAFVI